MKRAGGSIRRAALTSRCIPALHRPGAKVRRLYFIHSSDVAGLRATLVARGAPFGKVRQGEQFCLCDGKDPDGNPVQLSDR